MLRQRDLDSTGLGGKTQMPVGTALAPLMEPTPSRDSAEHRASTWPPNDNDTAGGRRMQYLCCRANSDNQDSFEIDPSVENAGRLIEGAGSKSGDESSVQARILAVGCISLAYIRRLGPGVEPCRWTR